MKHHIVLLTAALLALASAGSAQTVQFRATINGAQEVPASSSTATGTAVLIHDLTANAFDLIISLDDFTGPLVGSRIEEGAAGSAGTVIVDLGGESAYTRSGDTLTATFRDIAFPADKLLALLRNGAFLNFTTAAAPDGAVRGQLIAQPKRLYANIDVAQERAAFPNNANLATAAGYGAAVMTYDPGTDRLNLRISLYNYPNTLTNSHFHEQAPGVSGPVSTNLGAGTIANYTISNGQVNGTFLDLVNTGDPVKLLTGGAYLNFHSNINPGGEARGQVFASEELLASRLINLSSRGQVTPQEPLIGGVSIGGPEPVRVLITAKGPSLSAFGVTNPLANPSLAIYDSAGRRIASNDDIGATAGTEFASMYGVPTNSAEAALALVLPPGNYTAIVSSASGSGVALVEAYDLRNAATVNAAATGVIAQFEPDTRTREEFMADIRASEMHPRLAARGLPARALELCGAPAQPGAAAPMPAGLVAGK